MNQHAVVLLRVDASDIGVVLGIDLPSQTIFLLIVTYMLSFVTPTIDFTQKETERERERRSYTRIAISASRRRRGKEKEKPPIIIMPKEQATYSHGHHASVVTSHARRTVHDSAAFLAPHLKPTDHILDVGCGPGSITADLAALVPAGRVVGIDAAASVLDQARASVREDRRDLGNVEFEVADANALPYPDAAFDVVYCHQVLQHVQDPVGILREMRRVAKPGAGLVAAREADYGGFAWYPADPLLDRWGELYQAQALASGGQPNAGRFLHAWARQAGFAPEHTQTTVTSWCYTGERARQWGNMWADRAVHSGFAAVVKDKGLGTDEDLQAVSQAWAEWATKQDLFFNVPSTEILYRVPAAPATST